MFEKIDLSFLAKIRHREPDFFPPANAGLPKGAVKCGNGLLAAELGRLWELELKIFLSSGLEVLEDANAFADFFTQSHWPIVCLGDNQSNPCLFPKGTQLLVEGFVWPRAFAFFRPDHSRSTLFFYRSGLRGRDAGSSPDPVLYSLGDPGSMMMADFLSVYYNWVMMNYMLKINHKNQKRRMA